MFFVPGYILCATLLPQWDLMKMLLCKIDKINKQILCLPWMLQLFSLFMRVNQRSPVLTIFRSSLFFFFIYLFIADSNHHLKLKSNTGNGAGLGTHPEETTIQDYQEEINLKLTGGNQSQEDQEAAGKGPSRWNSRKQVYLGRKLEQRSSWRRLMNDLSINLSTVSI